ncbi:hypothetical protein BFRIPC_00096 (plasmid) [Peribacillus frigoritolerans]
MSFLLKRGPIFYIEISKSKVTLFYRNTMKILINGSDFKMISKIKISEENLIKYVQLHTGMKHIVLGDWSCTSLGWKASNDVTGGVYRVNGVANTEENSIKWSFILKVVIPSPNYNEPSRYNYWKREILAYKSGLLDKLPNIIHAPRCFGIDEQENQVWLWFEEVSDFYHGDWTHNQYEKVARLLGRFNGAYLVEKDLPTEKWLCKEWLSSWVRECDKFDDGTALKEEFWDDEYISSMFPPDMYNRYCKFHEKRTQLLMRLRELPKVFTHNDAWAPNLFLQENETIVAIDWAFAGITGVGEELGRFYGLCLHSGIDYYDMKQLSEILFENYCNGLYEAGWTGDKKLVRFGFTTSAGIRCGMIIPKIIRDFSKNKENGELSSWIGCKINAK